MIWLRLIISLGLVFIKEHVLYGCHLQGASPFLISSCSILLTYTPVLREAVLVMVGSNLGLLCLLHFIDEVGQLNFANLKLLSAKHVSGVVLLDSKDVTFVRVEVFVGWLSVLSLVVLNLVIPNVGFLLFIVVPFQGWVVVLRVQNLYGWSFSEPVHEIFDVLLGR